VRAQFRHRAVRGGSGDRLIESSRRQYDAPMQKATIALTALLFIFARSPEERAITDPATVSSPRSASARAVPIEDLFVSRNTIDPSWSPDGKEIAFSTNLTGRLNVWKVSSTGGWPVQLAVSDDR